MQQHAVVNCPRTGGGPVKISNIGLNGALVESPLLFLPLYAPLTLAFGLDRDGDRHDFRIEAMVIRHTSDGTALAFSELETGEMRKLHASLYPIALARPHLRRASEPIARPKAIAAESSF